MSDDEDLEDLAPPATIGHVELGEPHVHPAGWLILPDRGSQTGWGEHEVPALGEQGPARRVGFATDR